MQDSRVTQPVAGDAAVTERKLRVLVVEDDADQRSGLAQRLRFEGYDTVFAADAPSAVRVARITRPDLIILDLGLPGGDGYVVIERIRMMPDISTIPILVLSARNAEREQPLAKEAGAYAYFQKPIPNLTLRAAILQGLRVGGHEV